MRRAFRVTLLFLAVGVPHAAANLDEFIARAEPESRWEETSKDRAGEAEVVRLELVSQVWQGETWRHRVTIVRPKGLAFPDLALLFVTADGGWFGDDSGEVELAKSTGAHVVVLTDIPNQPYFGRREDDLVAHSFVQYLKTGDETWPLLLPMTKSVVKAMDAVGDFSRSAWREEIRRFVVAGASKRGWTSWLSAAVDDRVVGIAPAVFDNLNFGPQMKNQVDTWGGYSLHLGDYTERGLQALIGSDAGRRLLAMIDPFELRSELESTRKLVINGTNDPYWTIDSTRFYWDELTGAKSLLYVPNRGHDAGEDERARETRAELVRRIGAKRPMPELSAALDRRDGAIGVTISSDEAPAAVRLWSATSETRDFRRARWRETEAPRKGDRFAVRRPLAGGYTAVFAEAEYRSESGRFTLSTPPRIVGAE